MSISSLMRMVLDLGSYGTSAEYKDSCGFGHQTTISPPDAASRHPEFRQSVARYPQTTWNYSATGRGETASPGTPYIKWTWTYDAVHCPSRVGGGRIRSVRPSAIGSARGRSLLRPRGRDRAVGDGAGGRPHKPRAATLARRPRRRSIAVHLNLRPV